MRRHRRSYLKSFVYGITVAGGTTLGLVGAHHLLAPPGPDEVADVLSDAVERAGIERWARPAAPIETAALPEKKIERVPAPLAVPAPQPVAAGEAQRALARNIQRELKRVGCFTGEPDGDWSSATRAAMKAFNDSVKVSLPVNGPDYILLTLLQGHGSKACERGSPAITAKVPVPRPVARRDVATAPPVPVPARPPLPPKQATVAQQPAAVAPSQIPTVATGAPIIAPPPPQPASPIPGRMAVGAPPAPIVLAPVAPPLVPAAREAGPNPPVAEPLTPAEPRPRQAQQPDRRAAPQQQRRASSDTPRGARRYNPTAGIFHRMNRDSP